MSKVFKTVLACAIVIAFVLLALSVSAEDKIPVAFTFKPPIQATSVTVAGTFNGWSKTANPMSDPDGDGIWTTVIELAPGTYQYKFVVNGEKWYEDPYSVDYAPDGFGGKNSIIYVGVKPAEAATATGGLKFDGWFESKIERSGSATPNNYNDVYLKFSGIMRPGLETFTEIHAWKTLNLGSVDEWKDLLPLPVDGMEVNQVVLTLSLADGLSTKLYYKGHAGNTKDHLVFIKSDGEEDKIWDRKAIELVYSKAPLDGRIGLASLAGNKTMVYGEVQGEVLPSLTLGGLFSYETWPTDQREDGEDHRTNLGAYATVKMGDYTTIRGEILQTRATKITFDSTEPVQVEFVYPKEWESSGATAMYVRGSFNNWDTSLPMTKDADGNWRATVELVPGQYEYKFYYEGSTGNHWVAPGQPGGWTWVREVTSAGPQTFVFPVKNFSGGTPSIKGSWDGWALHEMTYDSLTGYYTYTVSLEPGTYEYGYDVGGTWYGKGDPNLTRIVGPGGREADYTALAYLAEVEYAKDLFGAKFGVKGAQSGFNAPYGLVGTDYRTIYADTWYKLTANNKLLLYAAYSTNGAGDSASATTTIKPGFEITVPFTGVEYLKGSYEINRGQNEVDTVYLETKYNTLKLCLEYKNNDPNADSMKITLENNFPFDIWGKVEYSKVLEGDDDNLYIEVTKKLAFLDATTLGVSYEKATEKLTLKLTIDF